jgi:hypothetical protein
MWAAPWPTGASTTAASACCGARWAWIPQRPGANGPRRRPAADRRRTRHRAHAQGIRISPRDNRLAAWGALLARGLLGFGRVAEAIEIAETACRSDDKIFLPRVVLTIAYSVLGAIDGATEALDDARRIRPRLSMDDNSRYEIRQVTVRRKTEQTSS